MSAFRLGVNVKEKFPYVNMSVEITDLMGVFPAWSQYKACFFLKILLLEKQGIKLNIVLGLLLKFDASINEN